MTLLEILKENEKKYNYIVDNFDNIHTMTLCNYIESLMKCKTDDLDVLNQIEIYTDNRYILSDNIIYIPNVNNSKFVLYERWPHFKIDICVDCNKERKVYSKKLKLCRSCYFKRYQKKLSDKGICTICGETAREGKLHCQSCADKKAIYHKNKRNDAKQNNICARCLIRPAREGRNSCQHCIDIAKAKQRETREARKEEKLRKVEVKQEYLNEKEKYKIE